MVKVWKMVCLKLALTAAFILFSTQIYASNDQSKITYEIPSTSNFYDKKPADIECVIYASIKQKVPANVLLALASAESGKNGQFVRNTNDTYDLSHFQINSGHWKRKGLFARYPEITIDDVAHRGCYNAELAAWMLHQVINEKNGKDYWTRVANYHSRTPKHNARYRSQIIVFSKQWSDWLQRRYNNVSISQK